MSTNLQSVEEPVAESDTAAPDKQAANKKRRRFSRRRFLAGTAALVAAGTAYHYGTRQSVKLGLIGVGLRGEYHAWLLKWLSYGISPYGNVLAICDADIDRANMVRVTHWPAAQVYQDYRKLLLNNEIEAVLIATHDACHAGVAVDAMRAGKAVYIEKPISLTVKEGFQLKEVAEQTSAVVQVGTQQRSHTPFHTAWELVNNGRLGELKRVVVSLGEWGTPEPWSTQDSKPPKSLDWNMWLGATADVPYSEFRHKGWHCIAEYSGGELTNWGTHHLDIALWVSGNHTSYPQIVDGRGTIIDLPIGTGVPGKFTVSMEYPSGILVELRSSSKDHGILFEGNRGRIFVNRARVSGKPVEDLAANPLLAHATRVNCRRSPGSRQKLAETQHYRDFFDCILHKAIPISDLNSSVCVHTALHLASNSVRLGRPIVFDPLTLSIKDDPEATALMSRPQRPEFAI